MLTGMKVLFLSLAKPQIPENAKLLLIISGREPGRLRGNLEINQLPSPFPKLFGQKKRCKYLTANNHIAKNSKQSLFIQFCNML